MKPLPYRARRVDNEKEIFGSYCIADGKHFIIPVGVKYDYEDDDGGNRRIILYDGIQEVHEDSVSQSTGRKDLHGVDVYGGMTVRNPSGQEMIVRTIQKVGCYKDDDSKNRFYDLLTEKLEIIPEKA